MPVYGTKSIPALVRLIAYLTSIHSKFLIRISPNSSPSRLAAAFSEHNQLNLQHLKFTEYLDLDV